MQDGRAHWLCLYIQILMNSQTPNLSMSCTQRHHNKYMLMFKTHTHTHIHAQKRLHKYTWQLWPSSWQQPSTCSIQCLITLSIKEEESRRLHHTVSISVFACVCFVCCSVCACLFDDMQIYSTTLLYTPHSLEFTCKTDWLTALR